QVLCCAFPLGPQHHSSFLCTESRPCTAACNKTRVRAHSPSVSRWSTLRSNKHGPQGKPLNLLPFTLSGFLEGYRIRFTLLPCGPCACGTPFKISSFPSGRNVSSDSWWWCNSGFCNRCTAA